MFDFFANHTVLEGDYALSDIKVEEQLGRGNAHVYTATIRNQPYALKQIEIKNDYEYQNFLKEISFMKQFSEESEWFVKYQGYLVTKMERNQYDKKKYAFIVMECAQQNLEQFLQQRKGYKYRLRVKEMILILQQIMSALSSLQELNIAHCDIKPENILIMNSSTMRIKLCDVGSCKIVSNQSLEEATILGTVPFLAPELIRIKNKKIVSSNPFKSDVFSFGLVVLYMVTYKKFKSHERLQIDQPTYKEVIYEWMKEAKQLADGQATIVQVLRNSLDFDQFKRVNFKQLKFICFNEHKKKMILNQSFISKLEKDQQAKNASKMQQTNYFSSQSQAGNQINLFKNRKIERVSFIKTVSNGNAFKISKGRNSPSPVKRTISCASSSPQKGERSMHDIFFEMKKVVYVGEQTKNHLTESLFQEEKNYVLGIPQVKFMRAETITLLPSCTYDVFYHFDDVQCKRIYIQTMEKECLGLSLDVPMLKFTKIRINLTKCQMIGGFEGLFRIVANQNLELLQLKLNQSQASFKQLIYLLDRLHAESPFLQTLLLSWQRRIFSEEQHIILTEKIAKLNLKKLSLILNQNYIKYEQGARWLLPKNCEIIYLDYGTNLLNNVVNNLCLSLANAKCLKQIYLNLQNNNLSKGQIHMLIKSIASLKTLQRVVLNFAFNKIEQVKYLQTTLLQLLSVNHLQIKLHRTEVDMKKILELIDCLSELFQFNLKMLKISCDRNLPLSIFKNTVEQQCISKHTSKDKVLRCDVVGFDNRCFTVYIKKKEKAYTNRVRGGPATKKNNQPKMLPKMSTMTEGITLSNFNSNSKTGSSICYQLYTSAQGFNNYICLTCCEIKQMNKYTYYCKFCLTSCEHKQLKDHYFVKVSESTRCVCAYSGCCKSDTRPVICGDRLGAQLKKQYQCLKCQLSFCLVCIQPCNQLHKQWVKQCKELSYFRCRTKVTQLQ